MNLGEIPTPIVGNLATVPELRVTGSGKAVANFKVAVNHRKSVAAGQWEDDGVTFVRVTVWGNLAENVVETFPEAGMPIMVIGTMRVDRWEDKEKGVTRDQVNVTAIAVGPNLQFSVASVNRPRKWSNRNAKPSVADEMFDGSTEKPTEVPATSSDDSGNESSDDRTETTAKPRATRTRKTATKSE